MRKATRLSFEPLEPRLAMATVTAALSNGVLTVTGTQGDDQVTIDRNGDRIRVAQANASFNAKEIARIEIDLGDGNDSVQIKSPGKSLKSFGEATTITAGDGNDVFKGPNGQKL